MIETHGTADCILCLFVFSLRSHSLSMISCLTLVSKIWILRRVTSARGSDSPWVQECVSGTCCTDAAQGQRKKKKVKELHSYLHMKDSVTICIQTVCRAEKRRAAVWGVQSIPIGSEKWWQNSLNHIKLLGMWSSTHLGLSRQCAQFHLTLKHTVIRCFRQTENTEQSGLLVVAGTGGRTSLAVPPTRGHCGTLLAVKCSELASQSSPTKSFSGGRHLNWRWEDRTLLVFCTVGFITKIFFGITKYKGNAMLWIVVSSIASYSLGLSIPSLPVCQSTGFWPPIPKKCIIVTGIMFCVSCLCVCSRFCYLTLLIFVFPIEITWDSQSHSVWQPIPQGQNSGWPGCVQTHPK